MRRDTHGSAGPGDGRGVARASSPAAPRRPAPSPPGPSARRSRASPSAPSGGATRCTSTVCRATSRTSATSTSSSPTRRPIATASSTCSGRWPRGRRTGRCVRTPTARGSSPCGPAARSSTTRCPAVLDQEPVDEGVRGDAYYVVVQAANGVSRVRLTGYLPRAVPRKHGHDLRGDLHAPVLQGAVQGRRHHPRGRALPTAARSTSRRRRRAAWSAASSTRPTPGSAGSRRPRRRWPRPSSSTCTRPSGTRRTAAIPVSQPTEYSHWDLFDLNRHAAAPLAGDDWYGLQADFAVQAAGPWLPSRPSTTCRCSGWRRRSRYAAAPAQPGPPATGLRSVGYKATLLIPQNLRLASAPAKVRRGRRAVLKGTLAVPADGTPGASVSWAPPGTTVTLRAAGRARLGAGQVREDQGERRLARRRPRPQDDRVARGRPGRPGPRRRALGRQAHRRHPLTAAVHKAVSPFRNAVALGLPATS